MLTKKLTQADKELSKLTDFLVNRDWCNAKELDEILTEANKEVERIQDRAVSDVLAKLQGSYSEEARCWVENKMTGWKGEPVKINAAEQRKARTEYNRMQRTINKLYEII